MADPPAAAAKKPCCVCDAPGGKHCTKCKSRHYCSKACQLVDWHEGGHKAQCKQLAASFQDRLLDELMPLKVKETPPVVVAHAAGSKAASAIVEDAAGSKARLSAVPTTLVKASAANVVTPEWRGTCAICLDQLPDGSRMQRFYECCCKKICKVCAVKCRQYNERCPLCRAVPSKSDAERVRRLQKHVDAGEADAQYVLGQVHHDGQMGLKKSVKRASQLYALAAAQGHAGAQSELGNLYECGKDGLETNFYTAAMWYRRASEQGHPEAQYGLGRMLADGRGVAQSHFEAVKWLRLSAAQGSARAIYMLGLCAVQGLGMPLDYEEALILFKRAASKGHAGAAQAVGKFQEHIGVN